MSKKEFLIHLSRVIGGLGVLVFAFHDFGEIGQHTGFSAIIIGSFAILSILMYLLGINAAKSENKYSFNNIIVGNMILKMILCVVLVLAYKNMYHIESRAFLLPFLVIYLVFTIFETYFLTKLAKVER